MNNKRFKRIVKNEEDASNAEEMKVFNRIDRDMAKLRKEYYVVKSDTEMNPEINEVN